MELDQRTYLHLDRERSWSDTLSASFTLLRLTYRALLATVFRLVGLWLGVAVVSVAGFIVTMFATIGPLDGNALRTFDLSSSAPDTLVAIALAAVLMYLIVVAVTMYAATIVQSFYRGYHEERSIPSILSTKERAAKLYKKLVKLSLIILGLYVAMVVVLGVVLSILGAPGRLIEMMIRAVWFCLYLPLLAFNLVAPGVLANEDTPLKNWLPRVFTLLRGRWWWAIRLGFVQALMMSAVIMVAIFAITVIIVAVALVIGDESSGLAVVMGVLAGLVVLALAVVGVGMPSLHQLCLGVVTYFTIRAKVDGGTLQERIDTIGADGLSADERF